jgi:hypothetical protein
MSGLPPIATELRARHGVQALANAKRSNHYLTTAMTGGFHVPSRMALSGQ